MIRLTTLDDNDAVFPSDIAFRQGVNGTEVRWNGTVYVVKESHDEVSQRLLDSREKRRRSHSHG